jgi:hypothetical protein
VNRVAAQPAGASDQLQQELARAKAIIAEQQVRLGQLETELCISRADGKNAAQYAQQLETMTESLQARVAELEANVVIPKVEETAFPVEN